MEIHIRDHILDFLRARLEYERHCWRNTNKKPTSVFFQSTSQLIQDFQARRVRFQPQSQSVLLIEKISNSNLPPQPDPLLIQKWAQDLKITISEATQLFTQFANFVVTDHRRRYGPLSKPQLRFLKKAADILEEGVNKGMYPHWNRTYVIGPMLKKTIKLQNILTQFPEVTTIEFRPFDPADFGCYFELPWDEYRLRRIPTFQPPASLVIDYTWCEPPHNYFPTTPHKTLHESIRAQEFNHLLMTLCPLLGNGDIMARLNDTIITSGGPLHTPDSITQDYCSITKNQVIDFLGLIDICGKLSKSTEPSAAEDWTLIGNAIQTLIDARFTRIGMHSRFALAISCIEGLLCKAGEYIGKEDLAEKSSLLLSTIGLSPTIVTSHILKSYEVRSKFVHGHRSIAAKKASDPKLLRSIEGFGRQIIIIACYLSHNMRFGNHPKTFRKYKLPAIFDAVSKNKLSKILDACVRPHSNKVRPLLN